MGACSDDVPTPRRNCLEVGTEAGGRSPDERQKVAQILRGNTNHERNFRHQGFGEDRPQPPAICFFFAELVDDQQVNAFAHRTLDPGVDACEGVRIQAATSRLIAAILRNLYLFAAQQVLDVHVAPTATLPVRIGLNDATQPVSYCDKASCALCYESVPDQTVVISHNSDLAQTRI
jgi:hypothetical protein